MDNKMKEKIERLFEVVWLEDIEHPTTPDTRYHHESIQRILKFINTELLREDETNGK